LLARSGADESGLVGRRAGAGGMRCTHLGATPAAAPRCRVEPPSRAAPSRAEPSRAARQVKGAQAAAAARGPGPGDAEQPSLLLVSQRSAAE